MKGVTKNVSSSDARSRSAKACAGPSLTLSVISSPTDTRRRDGVQWSRPARMQGPSSACASIAARTTASGRMRKNMQQATSGYSGQSASQNPPTQNHIPYPLYLLECRHRKPSLCASMWACVLRAPRRVDPRPRSRPRHEPPRKAAIRPNPKCTSHATSFRPHWSCDSWSGFVWSTPVSFPPAEETARSGPSSNHPGFA